MEADRRLAELVTDQYGVFTTAHVRGLGFGDATIARRIGAGDWRVLHRGVYRLAGVAATWRGDLLAACWAGGFRAAGSHRSAAAVWGLPGGRRHVVEIVCPRWRRAQHPGLIVHESSAFDELDLTVVDGIPVTSPELTLLGVAAVCSPSLLEVAVDAAENRGLVTGQSMAATVTRFAARGRRGIAPLRELVERRRFRSGVPESAQETLLRQALRRRGLPEPVMQFEVRTEANEFVARVDAAYPEARIAIEYDSYEFHGGRIALVRDSERRSRLLAAGWLPFTATHAEVRAGCPTLAAAIARALRRAA